MIDNLHINALQVKENKYYIEPRNYNNICRKF